MHFKRKAAQGRLSELAGKSMLQADIVFRSLKLERNAIKKYENSSPRTKKILQAYAQGVNDYADSLHILPIEFWLTFDTFDKWEPHHSYSLCNLMSFFMSLDILFEPFRHLLLEKYGHNISLQMMASRTEYNYEVTTILSDEDLIKSGIYKKEEEKNDEQEENFQLSEEYIKSFINMDIVNMLDEVIKGIQGSNSWVVHGNHTLSGMPLLANDPHLETLIPSMWYQQTLIWDDNKIQGVCIPGVPYIMIGRNQYMAWGITNNIADTSDFYVEKIKDNKYYQFNEKWVPLKEYEEVIKIRFESDSQFKLKIQETHHGPIIRGFFHLINIENFKSFENVISLSWIGFLETDQLFDGLYDFNICKQLNCIESSLKLISAPTLNLIYATKDNHIGYFAEGKYPVRKHQGNVHLKDGTNPNNDWIRYYNEKEQPRVLDPSKGFIVTANNKMASDNLINKISKSQISIPRARRITDILKKGISEGRKFATQDFLQMQQDVFDVYTSFIFKDVIEIYQKHAQKYLSQKEIDEYKQYIDILLQWNSECTKDSIGAGIYLTWEHYFLRTYCHQISEDEEFRSVINMNFMFDHFFLNQIKEMNKVNQNDNFEKPYCIIEKENEKGDCIQNLVISFRKAFRRLTTKYSSNIKNWAWGNIHEHKFDHKPFTSTIFKYLFERSYKGQGNRRTINVGGVNHFPDKWDTWYSANYRMVVDLSEKDESYWVIDTGTSENIFSPYYDDQMELHLNGQYLKMNFYNENYFENNQYYQQIQFQQN